MSYQDNLNSMVGKVGLPSQDCCNILVGTTGLSQQDCLNLYAGTTGLIRQEALNYITRTDDLSLQDATNLLRGGFLNSNPSKIPTYVADTDTLNWIDGTQTGSSTNGEYGWFYRKVVGAVGSVNFDTSVVYDGGGASIKISSTSGYNIVISAKVDAGGSLIEAPRFIAQPNSSYTISFYSKGDSLAGVFQANLREWNSSKTIVLSNVINTSSGTFNWELKTLTITTQATTKYLTFEVGSNNFGGTLWFDNVSLIKN